ncbi:MAG: hypothetical protein OEZ01_02700 [Candidatus Heimdallarchaeota archaeon]|nr:hypothetical protein [Candidatus Heimdallarchaeota archaeon]MDH5644886.1 hypothetical protein [Candidatus Heimdallarchaeota archaeon]
MENNFKVEQRNTISSLLEINYLILLSFYGIIFLSIKIAKINLAIIKGKISIEINGDLSLIWLIIFIVSSSILLKFQSQETHTNKI